jgi:hypothetical protein
VGVQAGGVFCNGLSGEAFFDFGHRFSEGFETQDLIDARQLRDSLAAEMA